MPTTRATRGPDFTAKQSLRTKHTNYSIPIIRSLPISPCLSSESDGPDGNLASSEDWRYQNAISIGENISNPINNSKTLEWTN